ncbi:MAG: amidohydrolase family protein [Propionibacteriaceae bacterium]|nr:amidohydrolase family protein [Propionibacteriaceae bacterium]
MRSAEQPMAGEDELDDFTAAYTQGMPSSLVVQRPGRPGGFGVDEDTGGSTAAEAAAAQPLPGAAPVAAVALGGLIVGVDGAKQGWLTIEGGVITKITTRRPSGTRTLPTEGVIIPGLIDLHGHPEFNVFSAWEPPKTYLNRYAWRGDDPYKQLIREPQNRLRKALAPGVQLRYAEIRALVGGVTAIQGASFATQRSSETLVRNVDGLIFGEHRARALIDLPASLDSPRGGQDLQRTLTDIGNGEVDTLYVHLAEGQRSNDRSVEEFAHLKNDLNALTAATVIIHGTALTRDHLGEAADAGAKLVWSPQSNLRLYRETTRAADAIEVGLPVALGADWLPSGSTSLLAEMKVARQQLLSQGRAVAAHDLVAMVTAGAAKIAGLEHKLGTITVGAPADVVVLARNDSDAYESVCSSTPNDVELVMIDGNLSYGRTDWVRTLAENPDDPVLEAVFAWGRPMLLNTGRTASNGSTAGDLQQLRTALITAYPQVGPIWA